MNNKHLMLCLALLSTSTITQAFPRYTNQAMTYLNRVVSDEDIKNAAKAVVANPSSSIPSERQGASVSILESFANSSSAHAEILGKILENTPSSFRTDTLLKMGASASGAVLTTINPASVLEIFSQHVKGDATQLKTGAQSVAPIAKLMPPEKLAVVLAQLTKEQAGAILEAMGEEAAKKVAQAIEEGYAATASNAELKAAMSEAAKTTVTGWTIWTQTSEAAPTVNKYQQLVDNILAAKAAGGISNQQAQQAAQQATQQSGGSVVVPSPSIP